MHQTRSLKEKSRTMWWQEHNPFSLSSCPQMILRVVLLSWMMPLFLYARQLWVWMNDQGTIVSEGCSIALFSVSKFLWIEQISCWRASSVQCISSVFIARRRPCPWFLGLWGTHIWPPVENPPLENPLLVSGVACWPKLSLVWREARFCFNYVSLLEGCGQLGVLQVFRNFQVF